MKNLTKKLTLLVTVLAAASAGTMFMIACSDDGGSSSGSTADGGGTDGSSESSTTDSGGTDAGPDRVVVEAGSLDDFLRLNAIATCDRYKECCGGGFDTAKCVEDFRVSGWVQSLTDLTVQGVADGGKVKYDPTAGSECLTSIRNMTCKNTPASEYQASLKKCFAAASGSAAANAACKSNAECATTGFCDPDAGNTCQNLLAANAECTPQRGQCSYRSSGAVQCVDPDGNGTANCGTPLANGQSCNFDFDCQSGACNVKDDGDGGITAKCDSVVDFLFGICEAYGGGTDGGDGG